MQLTPHGRNVLKYCLVLTIIINALISFWLLQRVVALEDKVAKLERNDKITQSVEKLDTKVNSLKSKVEGLFR